MKKLIMTTAVAASLLLGGCATTGTDTKSLIEQVRQAAVSVCGFLPTVDTVAQIILAANPAYMTASAIANGICAAVATIPPQLSAKRRGVPVVAGVVVHGRFVGK